MDDPSALYFAWHNIPSSFNFENSDVKNNKKDHRSGGALKEGCPYICIKHIIKLFVLNVF